MGIMLDRQDENERLTERINADLRSRAASSDIDGDYVKNSEYLKDTKKSGRFAWIWIVLVILALASIVFIFAL